MKHEMKKINLILNELISLMVRNGAIDLDINLKKNKNISEITLIQKDCHYSNEFVEKLRYDLNTQRQCELEGYYWQLVGDDDPSEQLHLVGAMVDDAEVEMVGNVLTIHITRNEKKC